MTEPASLRTYQIHESDLVELERILPELAGILSRRQLNPRHKTQIRRIKEILSNVRWDYGPPSEVEEIPIGNGDQNSG